MRLHPGFIHRYNIDYFNPRTPCGVRLVSITVATAQALFQSTHPVWGATEYLLQYHLRVKISIHAPRVGCDPVQPAKPAPSSKFQSTHPVWGATEDFLPSKYGDGDFNPRTPCGVRHPYVPMDSGNLSQFQSTHPVWGATATPAARKENIYISIHAPRVGCDRLCGRSQLLDEVISIHAPRVGCDPRPCLLFCPVNYLNPRTPCGVRLAEADFFVDNTKFQSTHPVWGATWIPQAVLDKQAISIHAPRVGCDPRSRTRPPRER